jgi:hypothetical protein
MPMPLGTPELEGACSCSRETIKRKLEAPGAAAQAAWSERLAHAIENSKSFFAAVEHWSHRFAILLLPVAALLLSGIFAF